MDYHKDTKVDSDASSSPFTGKEDVIDLTSYSVSYSITEAEMFNATTMTVSLPRQTMDKTIEGYDPNRIPLSVFTSKPSNPLEWSLASTETLFSIPLGKSYELDWQCKSMEAETRNAITIDSQNEADFIELKLNMTADDENFPANTSNRPTTTQVNVNEKIGENEERTIPRVTNECSVLEPIRENEINEDKASPIDRTTGSISMQGNQELSTSYAFYRYFRSEDRSGLTYNNPPNTMKIEIVEENTQLETVDQAPNGSLGGWFSCFRCCFSWKLACYGGH